MPAATPIAKNRKNIQGAVPNALSRYQPRPAPIKIANTNDKPTVLSAPTVRIVSAIEPGAGFCGCGSSIVLPCDSRHHDCHAYLPGLGVFGEAEPSVHGASTINPGGAFGITTGAAGLLQSSAAFVTNNRTVSRPSRMTMVT